MAAFHVTDRQREIRGVWDALEEDDISTERLMQMVADTCKCDVDDVAGALYATEQEKKRCQT